MFLGAHAGVPRDRAVALLSLILVAALAWLYLWRQAAMMTSSGMMEAALHAGASVTWNVSNIVVTFLMWSVMMVGMMLPSAAPAILLYGTMVRENAARGVVLANVWIFTAGYVLAWTGFSAAATVLQLSLQSRNLLDSGMESASIWLSSGILMVAGIYQFLPIKQRCLNKCRDPIEFFVTRWRPGSLGALRMGLEHGRFCVGCCWALMLVLFAAGVMNLLWVALIAGFVFVEKLLPAGRMTARVAGVGLLLSGLSVVLLG